MLNLNTESPTQGTWKLVGKFHLTLLDFAQKLAATWLILKAAKATI